MTIAKELEASIDLDVDAQSATSRGVVIFPPSDLESDEPPLETELHLRQIMLLLQSLEWLWKDRNDFYAIGNLTIYYSLEQKKSEDFRGPDFFVVLGTERKPRKSWAVWEEKGQYPDVIVEILSPTTTKTDKGLKKEIYQNTFRTSDYYWFDPYTLEFAGFHLLDRKYEPLKVNEKGHLWSQQLELYLGVREGLLRFFTPQGELVLTPGEALTQTEDQLKQTQESLEQTQESLEQTQESLEQKTQKAERLAAKLRELNIDPETI